MCCAVRFDLKLPPASILYARSVVVGIAACSRTNKVATGPKFWHVKSCPVVRPSTATTSCGTSVASKSIRSAIRLAPFLGELERDLGVCVRLRQKYVAQQDVHSEMPRPAGRS